MQRPVRNEAHNAVGESVARQQHRGVRQGRFERARTHDLLVIRLAWATWSVTCGSPWWLFGGLGPFCDFVCRRRHCRSLFLRHLAELSTERILFEVSRSSFLHFTRRAGSVQTHARANHASCNFDQICKCPVNDVLPASCLCRSELNKAKDVMNRNSAKWTSLEGANPCLGSWAKGWNPSCPLCTCTKDYQRYKWPFQPQPKTCKGGLDTSNFKSCLKGNYNSKD